MAIRKHSKFDNPRVDLTDDEVEYALYWGKKRKEHYSQPEPLGEKDFEQAMQEGALGELMACKYYEAEFDERIYKYGDDGADFIHAGKRFEVKSDTRTHPRLTVKASTVHGDIFILVWLPSQDDFPQSRGYLLGAATREELMDRDTVISPWGKRNYVMELEELHEVPNPE